MIYFAITIICILTFLIAKKRGRKTCSEFSHNDIIECSKTKKKYRVMSRNGNLYLVANLTKQEVICLDLSKKNDFSLIK